MTPNAALVTGYVPEVLIVVGVASTLLVWLRRRTLVGYRVTALGVLGFMLSQVVHLPLNLLLGPHLPTDASGLWNTALTLGLSAGLCEEVSRYVVLRTLAKRNPSDHLFVARGWGLVCRRFYGPSALKTEGL